MLCNAIYVKKSRVSLMLVEATGAISPRSLTVIGYHARRARGKHGRDATKYGKSRASTTNYFTHHAQRISIVHGRRHRRGRGDPPGDYNQETGSLRTAAAGERGRGLELRRPGGGDV